MRLTRCDHCRRPCFYPGAKPRASSEYADWNRVCPACAMADSIACHEATRYESEVEASFIHVGQPVFGSAYWTVFQDFENSDEYEEMRKENAERVKAHVLEQFQKDVSTFRTYDFSRPKVWSWNGG